MTDPLGEAASRLEKAVAGLETRVRALKAEAAAGEGDLFAARPSGDGELEAAAREASAALARAADELRAMLGEED